MDTQPPLTLRAHVAHLIGEVAKVLGDRAGESPAQSATRIQAVAHGIVAFQPQDPVEALFATHCVMLHEMMVDSAHHVFHGDADAARARSAFLAMDRAFRANVDRLRRYRAARAGSSPAAKPAEASSGVQPAAAAPLAKPVEASPVARSAAASPITQPTPAAPVARPAGASSAAQAAAASNATASADQTALSGRPSAASTAPPSAEPARVVSQEAFAALAAADPTRFARAMGVAHPSKEYLAAAAAQMSRFSGLEVVKSPHIPPFAHAGNRQARRHPRHTEPVARPSAAAN